MTTSPGRVPVTESVTGPGQALPRVLLFQACYPPGKLGGGSVRSAVGFVEKLGGRFRFRIVTTDRDLGSHEPYPGVDTNRWLKRGDEDVLYVRPGLAGLFRIFRVLREREYDLIFVSGLFSPHFSIFPILLRRLGLARKIPVILAPRGQLGPVALKLKRGKKEAFLRFASFFRLYSGVRWQASTEMEADEIRNAPGLSRHLDDPPVVSVARDLIANVPIPERRPRTSKRTGQIRLVFVSRISPMKNLLGAIRMLRRVEGDVELAVYGPVEDKNYWRECEDEARNLPPGIRVVTRGPIPHEEVWKAFSESHLFFFPTSGENFGFVIAEALQAGCPVLVSDRTPWRGLEQRGAGWDVPLEDENRFVEILQHCVGLDGEDLDRLSASAYEVGRSLEADAEEVAANERLFGEALSISRAGESARAGSSMGGGGQ